MATQTGLPTLSNLQIDRLILMVSVIHQSMYTPRQFMFALRLQTERATLINLAQKPHCPP